MGSEGKCPTPAPTMPCYCLETTTKGYDEGARCTDKAGNIFEDKKSLAECCDTTGCAEGYEWNVEDPCDCAKQWDLFGTTMHGCQNINGGRPGCDVKDGDNCPSAMVDALSKRAWKWCGCGLHETCGDCLADNHCLWDYDTRGNVDSSVEGYCLNEYPEAEQKESISKDKCPDECPADQSNLSEGAPCYGDKARCEYGEECCCGGCRPTHFWFCMQSEWTLIQSNRCSDDTCGTPGPTESPTELVVEPEYSCAIKPGTTDTACGSKCCGKQDQVGLTCYYDEDTETCMDGVMPTEPPSMYADCVIEGSIFKKGQRGKAKKAKDAEECYDKCAKDKKCKAYAFTEGKKKGKCALFSKKAKTKKMKDSENTYSAKSNCHPYDGKQ